jgi:secondary thiamine-phosphate synthase enzyme
MQIYKEKITFNSSAQIEFIDITEEVRDVIEHSGIREGSVCIFAQHTTMSLAVNHNEPMLLQDFMRILYHFAPVEEHYSHDLFELKKNNKSDGRSNGHSHCKAMLMSPSVVIPITAGSMMISNLQSIFAIEFDGSRDRDVVVQVMG